jgi:hypothetical protein
VPRLGRPPSSEVSVGVRHRLPRQQPQGFAILRALVGSPRLEGYGAARQRDAIFLWHRAIHRNDAIFRRQPTVDVAIDREMAVARDTKRAGASHMQRPCADDDQQGVRASLRSPHDNGRPNKGSVSVRRCSQHTVKLRAPSSYIAQKQANNASRGDDARRLRKSAENGVRLNFASWNRIAEWLKSVQRLKAVARRSNSKSIVLRRKHSNWCPMVSRHADSPARTRSCCCGSRT